MNLGWLEKWCIVRWIMREIRIPAGGLPPDVESKHMEVVEKLEEIGRVRVKNNEAVNKLLASLMAGLKEKNNDNRENSDVG